MPEGCTEALIDRASVKNSSSSKTGLEHPAGEQETLLLGKNLGVVYQYKQSIDALAKGCGDESIGWA